MTKPGRNPLTLLRHALAACTAILALQSAIAAPADASPPDAAPQGSQPSAVPSVASNAAALAAALLAMPSATAPAAADDDSMMKLLADRGLARPFAAVQALGQAVRDRTGEMVMGAMALLGVRYRFGGNDAETGFDCSGFTRYVFRQTIGVLLPRRAEEQANSAGLKTVSRDHLEPGDLVFFNTMKRTFSHVGIYVGDGKFIHAPRTGKNVQVADMRMAYWAERFDGARRAPVAMADAGMPQPR